MLEVLEVGVLEVGVLEVGVLEVGVLGVLVRCGPLGLRTPIAALASLTSLTRLVGARSGSAAAAGADRSPSGADAAPGGRPSAARARSPHSSPSTNTAPTSSATCSARRPAAERGTR
ncbi:hypothetical protein ACFYOV_12700 [Streptomyces sp. NPDC005931]|uniref:hypothetical protein n=1 Tax=Streptomyces sp. NPDC005931 TaxID=3364737 RepID=UPI00369E70CE